MSTLFSELQAEQEKQRKLVTQPATPPGSKPAAKPAAAQKSEQVSKGMSKGLSKKVSNPPTTETIETLAFQLRKVSKSKINTEVPVAWKRQLDDLAHRLQVGKYDLVMYILGLYLGTVERQQGS